jgi:hypothetical protein
MEKFNIPYEYMSDAFMARLGPILGRKGVFARIKLNSVNGDHLKEHFRWNRAVHDASGDMRVRLINWYSMLSLMTHGSKSDSLASVIDSLCEAMRNVQSVLYIYERVYSEKVHDRVKRYIFHFNRASSDGQMKARLYRRVRHLVAQKHMDKLSELYYKKQLSDVIEMFTRAMTSPDA